MIASFSRICACRALILKARGSTNYSQLSRLCTGTFILPWAFANVLIPHDKKTSPRPVSKQLTQKELPTEKGNDCMGLD